MANDYAPPTYDEVQAALSYIPTPATHNEWYPIAIAIKDALGENGFTLWDEWSRQGKGYNSSVVKSTWKSATPKPGGITAATLFRLARDNGYRPERPYVPPTPEQMAAREAEQRARDEAVARELADTRRQAAKKAYGIWKNADKTVDLNHAYLQRKGIAEAELVRGIRQNEYQGQRQLVIPLYQGGELVSVQTINEAGGKHFLKGGEKSGSYAVLGNLEREAHKGIVLAEGFATAASIRKATGAPVVIAFDSGNMIRIAENMASRLSAEQRVVFAADNDPSGTGLAAASQAAVILGSRARIALPDFSPETVGRFQAAHGAWDEKRNRENLPTDFNDLHLTEGIEAVRAQMAAALQMPERQPEIAPASETPQRPSERPAVRLKEGHIRLENPVAFERTPFGYRTAEMAHNAAFERRHITIAGGRIVGAHPGLAQEMGWATVGAIRPKSEQTLQQEAQAAAEQAARAAETAKTAQAAVAAMRLNETAAQIAPELRQQAQQDINAALNDPTLDGRERIIAAQETAAAYRDNGRPSENPAAAAPPVDPEWEQAVADERRMNEERRAERAPWRDFPRLIRNGSLAELKDAAGYTQAKAGDAEAAYDMVKSLLSTETLDNIRELAGGRVPILISVKAQESSGKNKIPEAMAHAIRASTGWPVDAEIVQINKPGRTGSGSSHRLAFQPVFDGKVEAGRDYLILDDNSTMGGTIASLRGYIENRGGRVIGAAVMSARETALDIVPTRNQLNEIQRKHGDAPNDYWTREFGYGIDRLTRAEAGVIRSAGAFDSIRDRIAAARLQAGVGVDGTTVPRTPVDTAQPQRDRSGTNRPQQEQPDSIAPAPTQAAAPDAAAFSMPAENAGQTEQEQNMAQQANTPQAERQPENHSPAPAEPASEAAFAVYPGRNYGDAPRAEVDADNRAIHFYESDFKKYEFDDISTNIGYRGLTPEAIQQQMDKDPILRGYYGITHNDGTVFFPRNEKGWSSPQKGKRPEKNSEPLPQQTPASTLAAKQEESVPTSSQQENGIEYGGSRTQESLRRIRSAERMQDGFRQPETPQQPEILLTKRPEPEIPAAVQKDAEPAPETPAKPKPVLDLNYETAAGLDARYVRYDGRYLDPNNARTVLFEDKGAKIKTAREDAQTISDMLDTAQAKNWDNIRISGSREFKRQMWLEAELRGIPNSGYSPSKEDLAMRDQMRAARERNSIEAGGLNRTAEPSAHNPPPRQPENRQSAHSPSEQLVADDSVRLKSEAANLQTRAETPAQTRAANRAAETAVQAAGERQSVPKPDSGRTVDKSQDPSAPNHALEAARAAYLAKADKLSKAAKEQLANHERDFAEAVKGIPEGNRESAMLHFYTSMQKRMSGTKLDMPEPTAAAQRGQTPQPEKPFGRPAAKQRDDGMDIDR